MIASLTQTLPDGALNAFAWGVLWPAAAFVAALAAALYFVFIFLRKRKAKPPEPIILSLLSANVGSAILWRAKNGFKLLDADIPVIADNIKSIDPDIIFLQEAANGDQASELFDEGEYFAVFEDEFFVVVRKGLFSSLSPLKFPSFTGGYVGCTATLTETGAPIALINVHTASPLKDPSFKARGGQIAALLDELARRDAAGEKLICAGDFNFDPFRFESFRHKLMQTDSRTELDETKERWRIAFGDENAAVKLVSSNRYTWRFAGSFTIDHAMSNLELAEFDVLDEDETRLDADHSGRLEGVNQNFMDHRAIFCRMLVRREIPHSPRFGLLDWPKRILQGLTGK